MPAASTHPLDPVFAPRAVAVVGASADPSKRGFQILRALAEAGYEGAVHPVNPRGGEILGRPVVPSVADLPDEVELAVICTPAATTPEVVAACGERGIRGAVILAVGFGESGEAGAGLEARVREAARAHGVRVVGPNTSGLLNLPLGLNLIGARGVRAGTLSLLVQSGNMALALMKEATERSWEGISICAGLGNETDVGFGESLSYLGAHPGTRAVLCYAEGLKDGRRFLAEAARVTREKPVLVLKAGRSHAGQEAARSHTGAVAGPYDRLAAGLRQAGVVEVRRTDELLHLGETLAWQPPPRPGTGVLVLSDGGGQGTLAADTLSELGAPLARLAPETREALSRRLGPAAATGNPVDLAGAADADPMAFPEALAIVSRDAGVGGVLVVGLFGGYAVRFDEGLAGAEEAAALALAEAAAATRTGVVVHSMYAPQRTLPLERLGERHIPVVASLEVACRCVAELHARGRMLESPPWDPGPEDPTGERGERAPAPIRAARDAARTALTEPQARALLEGAGLAFPPALLCTTPEEAERATEELPGPLALKVVAPGIPHKTEAGGVLLGVEGGTAVRAGFATLLDRARSHLEARGEPPEVHGILVTPLHPRPLAELLVGGSRDPWLGPVVSVGSGGVWVEVLADVAHRVLPADRDSLREMLRELRIWPVLEGARGKAGAELDAVAAAVAAVARCLLENPEVGEVEVNPLFVYPDRVVPVDARVFLVPPAAVPATATPSV